ncbi:sulfurtransferase TusA family protein [Patulibacter defluvii]|uniref:sulfurtransferase TusA family protein n=1 Tax=Patulibacter defluvii TaxID=3095358 RepID=UPI002A747E55|nr:sulfurtransferase TusA family protein [Patulibacter sp. DM4]
MTGGTVLDTSGERCPIPLLRAKQALRGLAPGESLTVIATDPEASVDFGAWAAVERLELHEREHDGRIELVVSRAA